MARQAKGAGSRGPIAQPTHLKLAAGDPEAPPQSVADVIPQAKPICPDGMTVSERKLWEQLVDALDTAGLIAGCDGLTVELAVRHYAAAVAAHKTLKRKGPMIYDDKNKRYAKNPAAQLFRDHSSEFREYAKLLGLAFAARARIAVPERGSGDSSSRNPFEQPTGT